MLKELRAKEIAFQLHIEAMQPVHDELTTEKGMHAMAMKPVFKEIESKRPYTYEKLMTRFNAFGANVQFGDATVEFQHRPIVPPLNLLRVTSDATWAALVAPREEDDNSYESMPSLHSYRSNME